MPAGRPPKPTQLKILHGNPGKRRLPENEPQPTTEIPEPPEWLSDEARACWDRVTVELKAMGILHKADQETLVMYCEAWDAYVEAWRAVQQHGMIAYSESGSVYQHPAVGIKNKAAAMVLKMAQEFGLTPSARTRVKVMEKEKEDEFESLLRERSG